MNEIEKQLHQKGYQKIAGLDEAGRGCWAGPLVVAICVLPKDYFNPAIKDSKLLKPKVRHQLFEEILAIATYYNYVVYEAPLVDQLNPKQASLQGMTKLIAQATSQIDYVLSDFEKPQTQLPCMALVKGDQRSQSIAAAAIIAKTIRDQLIEQIALIYPEYGFAKHQGYGTKMHQMALTKYGPIKGIHRFSYKPIKSFLAAHLATKKQPKAA